MEEFQVLVSRYEEASRLLEALRRPHRSHTWLPLERVVAHEHMAPSGPAYPHRAHIHALARSHATRSSRTHRRASRPPAQRQADDGRRKWHPDARRSGDRPTPETTRGGAAVVHASLGGCSGRDCAAICCRAHQKPSFSCRYCPLAKSIWSRVHAKMVAKGRIRTRGTGGTIAGGWLALLGHVPEASTSMVATRTNTPELRRSRRRFYGNL